MPDSDPQFISSIDTINISSGDNSSYATKIVNRGIPTDISSPYSRLVTGTEALDDTVVNHSTTSIATGNLLDETKDLGRRRISTALTNNSGV